MNHSVGQFRAQRFKEFINRLLQAQYPGEGIIRDMTLELPDGEHTKVASVDFVFLPSDGHEVFVETKAPYTEAVADTINRALRRFVTSVMALATNEAVVAIFAVPVSLPVASLDVVAEARARIEARGGRLEIWDLSYLRHAAAKYFREEVNTFSLAELELLLSPDGRPQLGDVLPLSDDLARERVEGERQDVVVLSSDFCSFSRFVHGAGSETDLITSVMGRFYRESRQAIRDHGGFLDKFMGDGILAYWFSETSIDQFEQCVQRLVGIALNLAEEWQDQIDLAVEPKGLRSGAAIGTVLFIPEHGNAGPVHAIGESINIAARLQSFAAPNSLVISNRLRSRHFADRREFEETGGLDLKNIGSVLAWRRSFARTVGA